MAFRTSANIDKDHHKGLVVSNSIDNTALIATGLNLTNANAMHVALVDGTGTQITSIGGGTQYAENVTTSPGTGTLALGRYNSSAPSLTNGQMQGLQLDSSGQLKITGSLSVGGTTDNSAFTAGSSTGTPTMGFYHSTIDSVTDGRAAAVAITPKRAMMVNLQTAAGVEITNTSNALDINIKSGNLTTLPVTNAGTFAVQATLQTQTDTVMVGGVNIKEINAVTPLMGNGVTGTGSQRVTIASDNTAFSVNATLSAETTKVIGTVRTADGAGNLYTTNSTTYTAKFAQDSNLLGTLGTAFTTAGKVDVKGADGDVFVRQATATNLKAQVVAGDATGAAVPANGYYNGFQAKTALPTAATDGNLTGGMVDKFGRQVVLPLTIRDLVSTQTTTISASTAETTIVTAGAAGVFNDLMMLVISNTSAATTTRIDFRDTTAGTVLFSLFSPAADTRGFSLGGVAIPQTSAATNWTATTITSTTDIRIYAVFAKNK